MASPLASLPIYEEVSITRAPRARDMSLWSAVFIYAMFLAARPDHRGFPGAAREP